MIPGLTAADAQAPAPPGPICGAKPSDGSGAPATVLLTGYGTGGFAVRTKSARAQAFFNNGMQLAHAFAHKASASAFVAAQRADPNCAMCVWGEAWARGPTINYPVDLAAQKELAAMADKAAALAKDGPEKERRLTAALQRRYTSGGGKGPGDLAFAKAMDQLARDHPRDSELAIMAADAWMIPASLKDNRENLDKALALLEAVLKRRPNDTGAIHFYIHATENDGVTARALPYALKLQALAPAASHLIHMPSHTYYGVGRYADAVRSNLDAVAVDDGNARRLNMPDVWDLTYHGHSVTFGTSAALMDGDGEAALKLARMAIGQIGRKESGGGFSNSVLARAYFAEGRYGGTTEVAALADPGETRPYPRAMWRYARGEAAARRGDAAALKGETALVRLTPEDVKRMGGSPRTAQTMVDVGRLTLEGRGAMLERHWDDAAKAFRAAAELQETKLAGMTDPPPWWFPVRRSLAAAELAAGRPSDAARDAKTALDHWPADPMSLLVLAQAERAMGHPAAAQLRMAEARRGWRGEALAIGPAGA